MSDRKCLGCEYWEPEPGCMHGEFYGHCGSSIADSYVFGTLRTTCNFGCDFWQKREPTLKEMLVRHLNMVKRLPHIARDSDGQADTIIAMFEDYQKGEK